MKEVIAIVNRRGGVGKTVTAHAIGAGLIHKGYKVLFIDLDSQGNLTYDLGIDKPTISTYNLLTDKNINVLDAVIKTEQGALLAASPALSNADNVITGTGKEYRLKEAIEPLKAYYDYFIIDTPPALNSLTVNALTAADSLIIPAQAEIHSLQGIGLLNEAIEAVKKYTNPNLSIKGIVITRYNKRTILSRDMRANLEAIAKELNTKVFKIPIRENVTVKEAQAMRTDIFTYAPKSNAAKDYKALVDEIKKGKGNNE
jgi:chromosome partitioning protein